MDSRDLAKACSRRGFLLRGARITTGAALGPTLVNLAGCGGGAENVAPKAQPDGLVLRASVFNAAPDGRRRQTWGYNREFLGPTIRAKEGEQLRIKVVNEMGVPTSIHWHGIHQHGTWQMDGVEDISRPPIAPSSEFTYEFRAEPAGTHWYHSHVGVQIGNGLFGPLIVEERTPIATYDREEVLLINDWFHDLGDTLLANLVKSSAMDGMPGMDGMGDMSKMKDAAPGAKKAPEKSKAKGATPAMEGKPGMGGMKMDFGDVPFETGLINGKGRAPGNTTAPLAVVEAKKGEMIRLRLINGSSEYAFRFQVDGHPFTVIATDGAPMKPVDADSLWITAGERYDVLLKADNAGAHWIRAVTAEGKEVLAVLRYAGSAKKTPDPAPVKWGPRLLAAEALRSPETVKLAAKPREVPLVLEGSMSPYRWSIGGQYFPKADPIVAREGESIRFLFQNQTAMDHPFHIHGHSFYILGKPGALNTTDPVFKDTVNIPAKSEVVAEWPADNPGHWFFHCHIAWHVATGMARVLHVNPAGQVS